MPYRVEYAKTGRAGCKGTECKKNEVKIGKGELRYGVWITAGDFESWQWRHWGCATTKVVANMAKELDNDASNLDGYEDLTEEDRARIRQALADGHVADEDLVGIDPEMNRPGAAQAKKEAEKEAKRQARDAEREAKKAEKQAQKEREKAEKAASKTRGKVKKAEDDDDFGVRAAPKSRKRGLVKTEPADDDDAAGPTAAPPNKRVRRTAVKTEVPSSDDEDDAALGAPEPAPAAKRGARKLTLKIQDRAVKTKEVGPPVPELPAKREHKKTIKAEKPDATNTTEPQRSAKRERKKKQPAAVKAETLSEDGGVALNSNGNGTTGPAAEAALSEAESEAEAKPPAKKARDKKAGALRDEPAEHAKGAVPSKKGSAKKKAAAVAEPDEAAAAASSGMSTRRSGRRKA